MSENGGSTSIRIRRATLKRLNERKDTDETHDELVSRLLEESDTAPAQN